MINIFLNLQNYYCSCFISLSSIVGPPTESSSCASYQKKQIKLFKSDTDTLEKQSFGVGNLIHPPPYLEIIIYFERCECHTREIFNKNL